MPPDLAEEIDIFEGQMELRRQDKIEDRVFAETRLRRGVYGQRYDNGHRHDGVASQTLTFPAGRAHQGPRDPVGRARHGAHQAALRRHHPDQLDVIAELAEEYSDGILHVTTRQDVQLHYVHIDDTPDLMRRLAAVGITTREACGNGVRNLTACPIAGVCHTEAFDMTAYADALFRFLLGHPDCQDFGRKFKIAFSGCAGEACGLMMMHDFGAIARQAPSGRRGAPLFDLYVGGGLGTTPYQAKLLYEDHPVEELLPAVQSIARVFGRLGEKKNRNRARIKFLVANLGIDEFRAAAWTRSARLLPHDERWTSYLPERRRLRRVAGPRGRAGVAERRRRSPRASTTGCAPTSTASARPATPSRPSPCPSATSPRCRPAQLGRHRPQVRRRRRAHHGGAEHRAALGGRAGPARRSTQELKAIDLAAPGAGTIVDVTACPGTDTCKLGIASSRGLAGELRTRLAAKQFELDEAVRGLRIKVSGCFNSCGQHHVADIGFFGNSRKINGVTVPHFQVVLGGRWRENAGSYGLAIGAVPSKRIPEVVDGITSPLRRPSARASEIFQDYIARLGKKELGAMIAELKTVPSPDEDPSYYTDWGDARIFTMGDMGIGECAGEVISKTDLELSFAESIVFDAAVALEDGDLARADERAYAAMVGAARALVRTENPNVAERPGHDRARVQGALLRHRALLRPLRQGPLRAAAVRPARRRRPSVHDAEATRGLVEEAQLFIDAVDGHGDPRGRRAVGAGRRSVAMTTAHHRPTSSASGRSSTRRTPSVIDLADAYVPAVPRLDPAARASTACRSTWPTTPTCPTGRGSCSSATRPTAPSTSARAARASSTSASATARGRLEDRFAAAIEAADRTAAEIEDDPAAGGVRFGRDEILLRVNDRLRGPNDDATLDGLRPAIVRRPRHGAPGSRRRRIERVADDPKGPLTIRVRLAEPFPRTRARALGTGPREAVDGRRRRLQRGPLGAGMPPGVLEAADLRVDAQHLEVPLPRRAVVRRSSSRSVRGPRSSRRGRVVAPVAAHVSTSLEFAHVLGTNMPARRGGPAIGVFPSPCAASGRS